VGTLLTNFDIFISMALTYSDNHSILIVDDNPTDLEVLSESLCDGGFQVAVAIDGESALEQVSYHPPALILLDVIMPGVSGFETCKRLKDNPKTKDIPVIFITALSNTEHKVKGFSLGAIDYITKPFRHEEVIARVRAHLKVQTLTQDLKIQNQQLQVEIGQKERAERQLLEANQKLEGMNQQLEVRVNARTQELSEALQQVQTVQIKLIQQEKMSALGQLVAGIAHEINNPVNFIYGNVEHATDYTHELLELVSLYDQHYPEPVAEIQQKIEDIDLDFLSKDLPKLLESMQLGTERIRSIVLSLRIFSRLDEAEVKDVDIHEGIDSTLLILNSRIKALSNDSEIKIAREYSPLPKVKCYPGQLNQVFMNILSNAIDALDEESLISKSSNWMPEIRVRTELLEDDQVRIHIYDNGPGIPAAIQTKIFDPFFTTKAIGKGTGLGMSISHGIITDKHHGSITCRSMVPKGTQFTITIPTFQDARD